MRPLKRPTPKQTVEVRRFAGWTDFVQAVSLPPNVRQPNSLCEQSERWDMGAGYDGALVMAKRGWAEGFKTVSVKSDAIAHAVGGLDMAPRLAEAGDEVDVGLFLAGEPECMIEYPIEARKKPVVRFVVSAAFSCCVQAEPIYNRGAAILAAIDLLEQGGVRVEFDLDRSVQEGSTTFRAIIPLKRAEEPLDRDKLAFAICHPAASRRLCFRLHEQSGDETWQRMGGWSYGSPANPEPDPAAVVVPCMSGGAGFESMEEASAFATKLISEAVKASA